MIRFLPLMIALSVLLSGCDGTVDLATNPSADSDAGESDDGGTSLKSDAATHDAMTHKGDAQATDAAPSGGTVTFSIGAELFTAETVTVVRTGSTVEVTAKHVDGTNVRTMKVTYLATSTGQVDCGSALDVMGPQPPQVSFVQTSLGTTTGSYMSGFDTSPGYCTCIATSAMPAAGSATGSLTDMLSSVGLPVSFNVMWSGTP